MHEEKTTCRLMISGDVQESRVLGRSSDQVQLTASTNFCNTLKRADDDILQWKDFINHEHGNQL